MTGRGSRIHPDVPDCIVLDHADGIRKHGFFEDDVDWNLEWGERPSKTHETRTTMECPSCGAVYRGGLCRQCGYEPTPKERRSQGLEFSGGQLREVKRTKKDKPKESHETIMVKALYIAGRSGMTFGQAWHVAKKMAAAQGTELRVPAKVNIGGSIHKVVPYGHRDGKRKVRDLYGVTVGKYTSLDNPYREGK